MSQAAPLIACHGCDLLLKKTEIATGKKLFCPRCQSPLYQKKIDSVTKVIAVSISGLLVFYPAVFAPLLTLDAAGMSQKGSIFDAFLSFYHQQYYFVAVVLFLTSILFPLIKLSLLLSVALQIKLRIYSRYLAFLFRSVHYLDEWGMPDVYLIALFVSIIKISSVASIQYDIGFLCFLFLVIVTRASVSVLDPELFWLEIEQMKRSQTTRINND